MKRGNCAVRPLFRERQGIQVESEEFLMYHPFNDLATGQKCEVDFPSDHGRKLVWTASRPVVTRGVIVEVTVQEQSNTAVLDVVGKVAHRIVQQDMKDRF